MTYNSAIKYTHLLIPETSVYTHWYKLRTYCRPKSGLGRDVLAVTSVADMMTDSLPPCRRCLAAYHKTEVKLRPETNLRRVYSTKGGFR